MGLEISKLAKIVSDLCSEVRCTCDLCHEACLCEVKNKHDTPVHNVVASASDAVPPDAAI